MIQERQLSQTRVIQCMAVIDIDPSLTHFKPTQQKWITSIELLSDNPKDIRPGSKILTLSFGLYLLTNFCEKSRLPIYEIDFISQPGPEWITVRMPSTYADKFGDCCLCYKTQELEMTEPLGDVDAINMERKSLFGHDKDVLNVPNGYKVVSNPIFQSFLIYKRIKSRLEQTFKAIVSQSYPAQHGTSLQLIPSFCFPEGIKLSHELKGFITFSYILTQGNGDRLFINYLTFKELLNETIKNKLNVKGLENIYYDKGICVISKFKYSEQLSDCLQHLYRLSMSKNDQPFFKVAQNFVNELKMPIQDLTHGFSYSYSGCNVMFDYDPIVETISDKSIFCVFKFLPLEHILTVFKAMLYQRQVIFVSQSKTVLGLAMQAFTSFLFPFKWENVIIPIVPLTLKQYLTAPIPFLAGVTTVQLIDLSVETEVVIVLLDSGKVMNDEDMPPLPQKMHKQLLKRLQQFQLYDPDEVKEYLQNPQNTYMFKMMEIQNPQFKGIFIREIFLQFFTTLMKNYKKYWRSKFFKDLKDNFSTKQNQSQLISDIFKVQDFLSDLGMNKVGSFGYKFTQGSIFTAFMERRHFDIEDKVANFFDDCLEKKKNKKFEGPLLAKIEKSRYIVTRHPDPEKEKKFYMYDRFPSILNEGLQQIYQDEISICIEEQVLFCQNEFLQFIEEETELNNGFYESAKSEQYNKQELLLPFLNLLTNQNKRKFTQQCKQFENISSNKKHYDLFRYLYEDQLKQIEKLLKQWPNFMINKTDSQLICLSKAEYMTMKLDKKGAGLKDQRIVSVWQGQNLEIIIKHTMRIIIVYSYNQSQINSSSQIKNSSMASSRIGRPSLQTVYLFIPNFRIKSFLNSIFKNQAYEIFTFIHNKVKNGSDNFWNIETVIELKKFLESIKSFQQKNQIKQEKIVLTEKTLSLEHVNVNVNNQKQEVEGIR